MKINLGKTDRILRVIVAIVIVVLFAAGFIEGTLAYILLGVAAIFALTSAVSFCPLYAMFGINTCTRKANV